MMWSAEAAPPLFECIAGRKHPALAALLQRGGVASALRHAGRWAGTTPCGARGGISTSDSIASIVTG